MCTSCVVRNADATLQIMDLYESTMERKVTVLAHIKDVLPIVQALIASHSQQGTSDKTLASYNDLKEEWDRTKAENRKEGLAESKEKLAELVSLARGWVVEVQRRLRAGVNEDDKRTINDWLVRWKEGKKWKEMEQLGQDRNHIPAEVPVAERISWLRMNFTFAD